MDKQLDKTNGEEYIVTTTYSIFEWSIEKERINTSKHGVSFEEAISVFEDDKALYISDRLHSIDEERFIIIGASNRLRILYVCHCYRGVDDRIRIISARKATETERKIYERGLSDD